MADLNNIDLDKSKVDDTAVVKDETAYNKKIKSMPKPEHGIGIDLNQGIATNVATAGESSQIDLSVINSFTQVSQRRDQLYKLLDQMCEDSIIAAILETYAEDATEYNDAGQIVWCESDKPEVAKYISYLLESMQVDKNIYKWVYSLCKYGDLYLQLFRNSEYNEDTFFTTSKDFDYKVTPKQNLNENKQDLKEDVNINLYSKKDLYVHYIEMVSNPAEMFELTRFGKTSGYIKADINSSSLNSNQNSMMNQYFQYKFLKNDINIFNGDKFVHACLEDNSMRVPEEVKLFLDQANYESDNGINYTVKRGQSLLYNTFKIWRELSLLENSMLLNRITKSAIVRLINVEVGDMPKEMVGPHLQGIKSLMEQKASLSAGESISEYTNPGPIENNIYVPTYNGRGAITADQIGGDLNVGQLPDIDYFQNKFFGSMRVPKQYFGLTDDGAGFNGGQSLAIISSRYAKMIKRIQNCITQALTDAINLMLLDKGLNNYINNFTIRMQAPTTQEEIDRRDNLSSKVAITSDIMNLVSEIENPTTKLKILKNLISTVITDSEIINLIQEEIDALEANGGMPMEGDNLGAGGDDFGGSFGGGSSFSGGGGSSSLDLDTQLGLDGGDDFGGDMDLDSDDSEPLPSPDDLGIDFTDNNMDDTTPEDTQ